MYLEKPFLQMLLVTIKRSRGRSGDSKSSRQQTQSWNDVRNDCGHEPGDDLKHGFQNDSENAFGDGVLPNYFRVGQRGGGKHSMNVLHVILGEVILSITF